MMSYYWSNVWEQFQTKLTLLKKLVHMTDYVEGWCCQLYIWLDRGWIFEIYGAVHLNTTKHV